MREKEDIGKLFKEKVDMINTSPNPLIWVSIKKELIKKKKNRFMTKVIINSSVLILIFSALMFKNKNTKNLKENIDLTNDKNKVYTKQTEKLFKKKEVVFKQKEETAKRVRKRTIKHFGLKKEERRKRNLRNKETTKKIVGSIYNYIKYREYTIDSSYSLKSKINSTPLKNIKDFTIAGETNLVKEPKDSVKKLKDKKRISLGLYNGFSFFNINGNSLNTTLEKNKKSNTTSYFQGIYISYSISKRISLRTGISNYKMTYTTEKISIKRDPQLDYIYQIDGFSHEHPDVSRVEELFNTNYYANITQNITYIEIPIEIKYRILSKKPNLNFILGYSLLDLVDNNLYISSNGYPDFLIGRVNNLKKLNSSVNFGVSTDIKLFKNTSLNLEILYKKYTNQYTNSRLNPNTLNIQTGIFYTF